MPGVLLSLARIGSYRSLLHAAAGAAIAVPVTPFALAAAVSVEAHSRVRALLALAVLMGLLGLLGPVRRLGIGLANTLLGTRVPAPEGRPLPLALISILVGCAGLPLGAWTIPFGLVAAFAALALTAAATFCLRAGATALLGPPRPNASRTPNAAPPRPSWSRPTRPRCGARSARSKKRLEPPSRTSTTSSACCTKNPRRRSRRGRRPRWTSASRPGPNAWRSPSSTPCPAWTRGPGGAGWPGSPSASKLGAANRSQAMVIAYEAGVVRPGHLAGQ